MMSMHYSSVQFYYKVFRVWVVREGGSMGADVYLPWRCMIVQMKRGQGLCCIQF